MELIVVGGGISGLAVAWRAASAGHAVRVLESGARVGGCIDTQRQDDGFWYELGAHTVYNSYGGLLELAAGTGVTDRLVERGAARKQFGFLRDSEYSWLTPPKVLMQLSWLEAAVRAPVGIFRSKRGKTLAEYYSGVIGPGNFSRVLSAFFAAVPSQSADGFPATGPGSLFKKRPRRTEYPRSFGFEGGLQSVCDAVAEVPGIQVELGVSVSAIEEGGDGFLVRTEDGRELTAPCVAVATPVHIAARILSGFGDLAAVLKRVATVDLESAGVVLPVERCWMPACAFVVPQDDSFFSAVTRDPFPDPERRAFAFHFRPGFSRDDRLERMCEVLRVERQALGEPVEKKVTLPAPARGHGRIVAELDRLVPGRLALVGNYFAGLAIEDCIQRAYSEWQRVSS